MGNELFLVVIVWASIKYRTGVFTTEKKAKKFLFNEVKDMKVWVNSIDAGGDKHYTKEPLVSYVNFDGTISTINKQINKLMIDNPEHEYDILITEITPNEPIQIN